MANIAKKIHLKHILCLLVAVCIALTAVLPSIMYSTKADTKVKKTLYMNSDGSNDVKFYNEISLVKDTEYSVSFKYHSEDGNFGFKEAISFNIFANSRRSLAAIFGDSYGSTDQRYTAPVYDASTQTVTYTFKFENIKPNTNAGINLKNGANDCYIGFMFTKLTSKVYISELTIWDTSDANKTNLLGDINTADDLSGWRSEKKTASGTAFSDSGLVVTMVDFDITIFDPTQAPTINTPSKMVYYKNSDSELLAKPVTVANGKTYKLAFCFANDVNSVREIKTNEISIGVTANGTDVAATTKLVSKFLYEKYVFVSYSVIMPEDIETTAPGGLVSVGLKFASSFEGYIFNLEMYDAEDIQKNGILYDQKLVEGLNKFEIGNGAIRIPDMIPAGSTLSSDNTEWYLDAEKTKHIKVVDYTADSFMVPTIDAVTVEPPEKMLFYKNNADEFIGKNVELVAGRSYAFTFSYANSKTAQNPISLDALTVNAMADGVKKSVSPYAVSRTNDTERKYTTITYNITIPENLSFNNLAVGVNVPANSEIYLFNWHICEAESVDVDNMFSNTSYESGLDTYVLGTTEMTGGATEWQDGDYAKHLKVVNYSSDLFAELVEDNPPKENRGMLYVNAGSSGPLYQRFMATAGATYIFKFSLSNSIDEFSVVTYSDGDRLGISEQKELINIDNKGQYSIYTYEIKYPENLSGASEGSALVFLGLNFGVGCEGYVFDFSLIKKDDLLCKQLYDNPDFNDKKGLVQWAWGWDVWFGIKDTNIDMFDWSNTATTLKVEPFDLDKINNFKPKNTEKMIYFKNGSNPTQFAAWINSNQGKNIILSYNVFSTAEVEPGFFANGDRWNVNVKKELLKKEEHGNYTSYTYRFVVPTTYTDGLIFVGLFINVFIEGYIFNMRCYLEDDPMQKSLWSNGKFKSSFNGWIWGWHVWFEHPAGGADANLQYWTNGVDEVELKEMDLANIDNLIADINRDDGEWWNPDDIKGEEDKITATATVKGIVKDQKGSPLKDIKLLLKGEKKSYNTVTDANGAYEFKDVAEGFYELYFINNEGQEVNAGFFSTLSDYDVAEVNVVCDTSGLEVNEDKYDDYEEEKDADEEEKIAVTTFSGTVYTPQLKTVAGLKLYLRGFDETVTDENGNFVFEDVPVGEYELYAITENGKEYVFRTVKLEENVKLSTKLKYDVNANKAGTDEVEKTNIWLWVIIGGVAVLVIAGGAVAFVLIRKKRI